jgi:hypothetical protein
MLDLVECAADFQAFLESKGANFAFSVAVGLAELKDDPELLPNLRRKLGLS